MVPTTTVEVADATARAGAPALELLEDHDDVQLVAANFDIPDEILESLEEA